MFWQLIISVQILVMMLAGNRSSMMFQVKALLGDLDCKWMTGLLTILFAGQGHDANVLASW
jgi:hypothetical protein